MKVIDLLNMISKGEEVPKFWWNGCIHQIEKDSTGNISIFDTYCKKYKKVELEDLNEEIKFLEEDKKIEPLECYVNAILTGCISKYYEEDFEESVKHNIDVLGTKINEIIDKINKMETK